MTNETVFTLEATPIKFGPGASADAGWELKRLGRLEGDGGQRSRHRARPGSPAGSWRRSRRPGSRRSSSTAPASSRPRSRCRRRPTSRSTATSTASSGSAAARASTPRRSPTWWRPTRRRSWTTSTPPVGEGKKPPGPLKPLLAIPTTAGTGSEATTVAVLDVPDQRTKSGISHRYLRPHQGIVDPELPARRARRGHLVVRARRRLPRGRVVRLQALRQPRAARVARRPAALPGRQPGLRRVVGEGARVRRALPAPRGAGRRRPRGARRDDARRQPGRHRLRLRRRAHPARVRLSDRVAQARVRSRPATRTTIRSCRTAGR